MTTGDKDAPDRMAAAIGRIRMAADALAERAAAKEAEAIRRAAAAIAV
ncbi:hypothetical protein [Azospirillum halopraeferens]|nr:hypothetical protein [Azospirillum halopraeferens]